MFLLFWDKCLRQPVLAIWQFHVSFYKTRNCFPKWFYHFADFLGVCELSGFLYSCWHVRLSLLLSRSHPVPCMAMSCFGLSCHRPGVFHTAFWGAESLSFSGHGSIFPSCQLHKAVAFHIFFVMLLPCYLLAPFWCIFSFFLFFEELAFWWGVTGWCSICRSSMRSWVLGSTPSMETVTTKKGFLFLRLFS